MRQEIVVIGSLNLDLVATVPRFPQPGETLTGSSFSRHTGGKGANQAVAAALAGARVGMIARHGTDGFEHTLLATLSNAGVDTSGIRAVAGPSGVALIMVTEAGENSIVLMPGSNGELRPEDLHDQQDRIAASSMVLIQLETPVAVLRATLEQAARSGVPVMLDPAPMRPLAPEDLRGAAWLTPNETEAALLVGAPVPAEADGLREFAKRLLAMGPRNVLLKLGAKGAFLATSDGLREPIPGHVVDAVDSTAAGDALNGAMAAALVRGADAVEAARFGVAAAAISVTRHGAIASLACQAEIEGFLASISR